MKPFSDKIERVFACAFASLRVIITLCGITPSSRRHGRAERKRRVAARPPSGRINPVTGEPEAFLLLRGASPSREASRPKEEDAILPTYEATYIVNTAVTEADLATVVEKYQNQISGNGEILSLDNWGRRRMAYEIASKREGTYVTMRFKAEAAVAAELDRTMKIDDNIIRALIVRAR